MKILIITPRIPFPPYRGDKLKIFNLSKTLARTNSVTILTFHENSKYSEYIQEIKKFGIEIRTISLPLINSLINMLLAVFSKTPFQVAYYYSKKMKTEINKAVKEGSYDVIYFHLIRSAQYLDSTVQSKAIKVIDFTDDVSLYLSRFAEITKNPFKKIPLRIEAGRIERYEKIAQQFDTLFICSENDRDYLIRKKLHPNIQFLRNGFDSEYFQVEKIPFEKHRIIFTGNMPYFPNRDAVKYFAKEVFPGVLNKYPDSKFYIVGQKPKNDVKKLSSENIFVTGFVKDIKREYLLSEVNVVPIRFGAGTLNKVIESLSLGIPTIATSMSVAGLPAEIKKYILLADDSKAMLEKIIYVFENSCVRDEMMNEAREVVFNLLNWGKIINEFESYLKIRVGEK